MPSHFRSASRCGSTVAYVPPRRLGRCACGPSRYLCTDPSRLLKTASTAFNRACSFRNRSSRKTANLRVGEMSPSRAIEMHPASASYMAVLLGCWTGLVPTDEVQQRAVEGFGIFVVEGVRT